MTPPLRSTAISVLVALSLVVAPLQSWGTDGPMQFPGPDEGYTITPMETHQMAPEGYEGATDILTETAVGDSPYTQGKRYVIHFTISNRIQTCPDADGTVAGEGTFSVSYDSTEAEADGTTHGHIESVAKAKYKGQVGDDARIQNPVNADIDYSYVESGTFRGKNGAIATTANKDSQQHITIPILVAIKKGDMMPSFGDFKGGDPTEGHLDSAFAVGLALAFWAGFYYSVAETKWTQANTCVQASFNPPSHTLKLVLGGQMKVDTEVKTKAGVRVKAQYPDVTATFGTAEAMQAYSDVGQPMKVTYTAPDKKPPSSLGYKPGFVVSATSRAGVAQGVWEAGLGTNWSGQITCEQINSGDQASSAWAAEDNSAATRITIYVTDGKAEAVGYSENKSMRWARQPKASGGSILDHSDNSSASLSDASPAEFHVTIDKASGTYSIQVGASFKKVGTQHFVSCSRETCSSHDSPFYVEGILRGIDEKLDDPNHLHGSKYEAHRNTGSTGKGTMTWTMSWDLARQGTSQ